MLIDKKALQALIPHQADMCLLDGVLRWDERQIVCQSDTHRNSSNPLRSGARLNALHAFEYGAQAVAVHGGLRARQARDCARPGYLAALRDGQLFVDYLDDIADTLIIQATMRYASSASYVYDTQVEAGGRLLAKVRISIVLMSVEKPQSRKMR